ncbi:MAG: hypothetical protein J3R72DRAFT_432155 [Linnemannia gamsii]|nr:MAG: hypothetical protein J3R72DRAFT_432155 [Linnemannia gamsii]
MYYLQPLFFFIFFVIDSIPTSPPPFCLNLHSLLFFFPIVFTLLHSPTPPIHQFLYLMDYPLYLPTNVESKIPPLLFNTI